MPRSSWAAHAKAAEAFLGRKIEHDAEVSLAGRLERRDGEIRDGAHTPEAVDWLLARIPARDYVLCVSILREKRVDELLERLGRAGSTLRRDELEQPARAPRQAARRAGRSALLGRPTRSPIRAKALARARIFRAPRSRHRLPLPARGSPRARGRRCTLTKAGERHHRLRVRGRRRAVDRGDRVRSGLHRRATSPITVERK